jgi:hypothetical protein
MIGRSLDLFGLILGGTGFQPVKSGILPDFARAAIHSHPYRLKRTCHSPYIDWAAFALRNSRNSRQNAPPCHPSLVTIFKSARSRFDRLLTRLLQSRQMSFAYKTSGEVCAKTGLYWASGCGHACAATFTEGITFPNCKTCAKPIKWIPQPEVDRTPPENFWKSPRGSSGA